MIILLKKSGSFYTFVNVASTEGTLQNTVYMESIYTG